MSEVGVIGPTKEWPLFTNYVLFPNVVVSSRSQNGYRVRNLHQPWKHLAAKICEDSHEMDFYMSLSDNEKAGNYLVECVEWGEFIISDFKFFALVIMERGGENCADYFQVLQRDNVARYHCIEHVIKALQFIHSLGWIHGNINLENVVHFELGRTYKLANMDFAQQVGAKLLSNRTPDCYHQK